ncbi:MAG TPA: YdeI/OmpD-associated family protein, partial [Vicinamibacterales bacterium]|nr:YdeI/OmpD-associated family protein [Vicinamibacterales bacterium]
MHRLAGSVPVKPRFFATAADLRAWFDRHAESARELWVGYYKRSTGRRSVTWSESVDEALCVGWIDGIRRSLDAARYVNRFTPRRKGSVWSAVNIRKAEQLIREGRMRAAGLAAFEARRENRSGIYSYEQRRDRLEPPYEGLLRKQKAAWVFFQSQPASYRKAVGWWVVSAKREETRLRRLEQLIDDSTQGRRVGSVTPARRRNRRSDERGRGQVLQ